MNVKWQFDNGRPIYMQIVEQIKRCIVSGELKVGDRVDSVREIAAEAKVNPNTVQRAFSELEETGLLHTERTNGRFITEDSGLIEEMKNELARKEVRAFLHNMEEIGFNKADMLRQIECYGEDE